MTKNITVETYKNAFGIYEAVVKYTKDIFTVSFRKSNEDYNALCKAVIDNIDVEATVAFNYLGERIFVA